VRFYTYRITAADNVRAERFAREAIGRLPDLGEAYHILSEILWYQAMTLGNPTVEESRSLLQASLTAAEEAISLGSNAHSAHALLLFGTTNTDLTTVEKECNISPASSYNPTCRLCMVTMGSFLHRSDAAPKPEPNCCAPSISTRPESSPSALPASS